MTGSWPVEIIDHINRDKTDNRFANLREATIAQNNLNRGAASKNGIGLKCIYLRNGRYTVQIKTGKSTKHVGVFDELSEAALAYNQAAKTLHGEFFVPQTEAN